MKDQRFGIEVEMTGLTRQQAAQVAAEHFGSSVHFDGTYYGIYSTLDSEGRQWKFMSDGSIETQRKSGRQIVSADSDYSVEMVSPICRYGDIETIQELVRKLRGAGMLVNSSTGIQIHVDASPHNAKTLRNITNIMASKEDLIYKALQVEVARERQYCKKVDQSFLDEINRKKPKTLDAVSRIWYGGESRSSQHYDNSRYHCLNLHSVFQKGTIEFRLFNSTTHAGKIKAYIQLCLAISAQALNQKCASRQKTHSTNEKYTFRTWLLRLGLAGSLLLLKDLCRQMERPVTAEQLVRKLQSEYKPHEDRGWLRSRVEDIRRDLEDIGRQIDTPGIRSEDDMKRLCRSYLSLALDCVKARMFVELESPEPILEQEQAVNFTMSM